MATGQSPEFEFWMVRNPPFPPPKLSTADELFVDGVILPLHLLRLTPDPRVSHQQTAIQINYKSDGDPNPVSPPSRKWKDMIRGMKVQKKKGDGDGDGDGDVKLRRRNQNRKKNSGGTAPELNINIWPFSFSRSRSAGNGATFRFPYKKLSVGRKVSSAPCSRSNSRGESSSSSTSKVVGNKSVKYPLPRIAGVGGVHVGRINTIWQVRRGCKKNTDAKKTSTTTKKKKKKTEEDDGEGENGEAVQTDDRCGGGAKKVSGNSGVGIKALSLNVNTCIGNKLQTSCSGEEDVSNSKLRLTGGNQIPNKVGSSGSHFNLKTFFAKKVY